MSYHIITPEIQEAQRKSSELQFKMMMEEARQKSEARKAHEKCRCPHCGRNDPLPPWLY